MAKETSTFNITDKNKNSFDAFCSDFSRKHPEVRIRVSRIYGKRWSFIAGDSEQIEFDTEKFKIDDEYGVSLSPSRNVDKSMIEEILSEIVNITI